MPPVSIGASTLPARSALSPAAPGPTTPIDFDRLAEALIGDADAALYRSKSLGGGRLQRGSGVDWPTPAG